MIRMASEASQVTRIKKDLEAGKVLDPMQALHDYGCLRLAARIKDVKDRYGLLVEKKMVKKDGKEYATYRLNNMLAFEIDVPVETEPLPEEEIVVKAKAKKPRRKKKKDEGPGETGISKV